MEALAEHLCLLLDTKPLQNPYIASSQEPVDGILDPQPQTQSLIPL